MLLKENRLNLEKDFKRVAAGKKIETRFARLFILRSKTVPRFIKLGINSSPRIGIAVSGKVFKKASDRNRARRLISKSFEVLYSNLPVGINIVALPKAGVVNVKSEEVLQDLEQGLKKESVII